MSPAPVRQDTDGPRPQLRLKDVAPSATVTVPDSLKVDQGGKGRKQASAASAKRSRKEPARKGHAPLHVIRFRRFGAWALFFALGGASYAIRYQGWLELESEIMAYGPWAILFLHVVITILAAQEDLFTGALCFLVPGYSLYYLLARSGRAWLCAITCGLLVGTGEDSWLALQEVATNLYDNVNTSIAGAGERP